jgi:hypothetical protein
MLRRIKKGRYAVEVDGAEYGQIVWSAWTGDWQAYTVNGVPVGIPYRTRDEAAERLLLPDGRDEWTR